MANIPVKLNEQEMQNLPEDKRWALLFAIAAAGNLDGEHDETDSFRHSSDFLADSEDVPEWSEIWKKFGEFFGFDFDSVLDMFYY